MTIVFLDPVRSVPVSVDSPEVLARTLIQTLPARSTVRFLDTPFSLELPFLKSLQVHLEREQLFSRHDFVCQIAPETLTPEACATLAGLNFSELEVVLPLPDYDLESLARVFALSRNYRFKLALQLGGVAAETSPQELARLYFFLREHLGDYVLHYPAGLFDRVRTDFAFRRLAVQSQEVNLGQRFDQYLNEQFYGSLYEYLRLKLSPHVQTVLEINPFASLSYYQEFNRMLLPWKVTLSSLPQHQLDHAHLQQMGKTFDAIVLFQTLPRLRDPQKELLVLQNYARSTTEWVCVQFNLTTLPTLTQLVQSQFHNGLQESAYWPLLRMQGMQSLEDLFRFSGIQFDWTPTRVPITELKPVKDQLDPVFEADLPQEWKRFLGEADILCWSGHGSVKADDLGMAGFGDDGFGDGFVSGGFL